MDEKDKDESGRRLSVAPAVCAHDYVPLPVPAVDDRHGCGARYLEGMYLRTREPIYETAAKFWTSLYAVSFAMGVATGIVMEFQFGTNWAPYSRFVGDVFGSALAAEGIFAFFLESGFLAVLVFGWDKVTPRFHFLATTMVALDLCFRRCGLSLPTAGSRRRPATRSSQGPATGIEVTRAETADFWGVIFNPSTIDRITHTLIGAFILGSFFIMSISAWYLLTGNTRNSRGDPSRER